MKEKMKISLADYIRANRKAAREEEIREYGRPVRIDRIHKSKKVYNRKSDKAELNKDLPYFFGQPNHCGTTIVSGNVAA